MDKKASRLRRAAKTRATIKRLGVYRLSIHRTASHIYAQLFNQDGSRVLASASTVESAVAKTLGGASTGNMSAAVAVGKAIGERALAAGVTTVAFDRAGYKYHGRVKALADAAREAGLQF